MKELETERLILRGWRLGDAEDLYEYAKNPEVGRMAGWEPLADKEQAIAVLKGYMEDHDVWAICLKENGKAIGHVKMTPDENRGRYVAKYISYAISVDYWGKGYMTEAAKAVIKYVFEERKEIDMLSIFHSAENCRSRGVVLKCGFIYDCTISMEDTGRGGRKVDNVCYHLLRKEYYDGNKDSSYLH